MFGMTRTLPSAGCPAKLSNRGRRNLMVTLAELQRSCGDMGETYRRTTITGTLHQSGLYGSGQTEDSPQWNMKVRLEFATSTEWETRFSDLMKQLLNCLASILSVMSGGNHAPLITYPVPSQRWNMVVAASCCGGVFQQQGLVKVEGKQKRANTEISLMKTRSRELRTSESAEGSPSNRTMTLSTQPR